MQAQGSAILFSDRDFAIAFDPLDLIEETGSVLLRIEIEHVGRSQTVRWTSSGEWIEYESLDRFAAGLASKEVSRLLNVSGYQLLELREEHGQDVLLVNPPAAQRSRDGECLEVKLRLRSGIMYGLANAFRSYPKWW